MQYQDVQVSPQPTQHGVFPGPSSPGPQLRVGPAGPADHRPPEEARRAPSSEVAARSCPGRFPLVGYSSLVYSYAGRRRIHASPRRSLGTPSPQKAFQTITATPTTLLLLQPLRGPQFTAHAFTYPSGPVACPSASVLCMDLVYIIGSSIVRHVRVRGINRPATVSCFPGARVLDIARRLPSAVHRHNAFGTVVIHVGTNDISDRRSEVLKEHYQTLLDTAMKKTDARLVISGPLPTCRRGSERFRRLFTLQSWLRGWCAFNGLGYGDNWSSFWEQPAHYQRNGLHPSRLGSVVLSRNIERAIH
ncbi:hypothetical protein AOLI_G00180530 [Acnodon oligacanthus]